MKKASELKAEIRNAENMMAKYPEDANLVEACQYRIKTCQKELEALKKR